MSCCSFDGPTILGSVTEIVSAHLIHQGVATAEVADFIRTVHATISELERANKAEMMAPGNGLGKDLIPAVPVKDSVQHEHIVCLEDGRKLRVLKRYLMKHFGLTPEAYRAKWGLPADYPMAAPAVSEKRRADARKAGLGKTTKPGARRS